VSIASGATIDLKDDGTQYHVLTPTSGYAGQSLTMQGDVRNGGTAASGAFAVRVYASTDSTINTSDTLLATVNMASIPGTEWGRMTAATTIPSTLSVGSTYRIGWIIDSSNVVSESNESNNTVLMSQQFTVTAAPDSTNPTISITTPAANGTTVTSPSLSISGSATDNAGLTQVRYALNSGSSVQASLSGTSWSGTVSLVSGPNTIYAYSQDTSGNTSPTITRTVNYSAPTIDLRDDGTQYHVLTPTSGYAGQSLTVQGDVRNGGAAASGAFTVRVYASTDATINTSDTLLATVNMPSIPGTEWVRMTATTTIPASLSVGTTYRIGWMIDSANVVSESNESNNTVLMTQQLTVTAAPDTTLPTLSITYPAAGTDFGISSITFSGTASDNIGVAEVQYRHNSGSWLTATGTTSWSASITLTSGSNTLEARARDAANNYSIIASRAVTYSAPTIDLRDDGTQYHVLTPTSGYAGQSLTVQGDVRNGGAAASGAFTVRVYASTDATINTSDTLLATVNMPSIPGTEWVRMTATTTIPVSLSVGTTYRIGWMIDSANVVSESNESNNTVLMTQQLTVTATPSGNANMVGLTLSAGTLNPAFVSGTTTYTAVVPNTGSTITVTPTLADANATVRVNGNLVTSGTPSGAVSLSVGSNPAITVLVTAQDGTTKAYSVTPTRNPLPIATTLAATAFGSSTATLNGTVNPQGVSTTVTFRYGTTTAYGSTVNVIGSPFTGTSVTNVSAALTGLLPGTLYHYQILAANSTDSNPGSNMTFTTVSDNARLTSLGLNAGSITFQPDTLIYSTTVPNSSISLTVTPSVQQVNATLRINNVSAPSGSGTAVPLNVGDNTLSIAVTAQDGTTTRTYTLNVRRRSADASLASLNLSGITLNPAFAAGTTNYTATVPFLTTSTNLAATTTHSSAVVTSGTGLRNLVVGANALNVLVTAEDGNTLTYTVTVTRDPASTNASLAGLTLSAGTLTPAFASGTLSYSATVAANVTSVTVTPTVQQANATLTIQGTTIASGVGRVVSLVTGDNTIPIVVTAQDGTTIRSYSLTVRRRSAVADLASLSLSGVSLSPAFSSSITSYTATVPNATASTTINATTTHASASVAGDGLRSLNIGSNPLTVTVTAEDGNAKDYTLNVLRNPLPVAVTGSAITITATSATLHGSINAGVVSTATSFEYGTSNAYAQTISGSPSSVSGASPAAVSAELTNLTPGTQYYFRIKGTNSTDSTVGDGMSFTTLRNNANLAALVVSHGTLAFNPITTTYNLTVANAATSITVTPTVADSLATVKVNNVSLASGGTSNAITLVEGINPAINILVTAEDGTTKNYELIYYRALLPLPAVLAATDVSKSKARLNGTVNARGTNTVSTFEYSLDPNINTFTTASATPGTVSGSTTTNISANVTGLAPDSVYYYRIRSVSAAGTQHSGTQTFTTALNDAYLTNLAPSSGTLSPAFSATSIAYTSVVGYDTFWLAFTPTAPTPSVLITVNGSSVSSGNASPSINLTTGDNTITVVVTDTELSASRTYTITVTRQTGPPTIQTQPESKLFYAGESAGFWPVITGAGPMTYVWKKNNAVIRDALLSTYNIQYASTASAGRYLVEASNSLGKRISTEALLGVINLAPEQINVVEKGVLSLTATAAAPPGVKLSYRWHFNYEPVDDGGKIRGAKTAALRVTNMTVDEEGQYHCLVTMPTPSGDVMKVNGYTQVYLTELPNIFAGPLPDGAVSAPYSADFPVDTVFSPRKTPSSYSATGLPAGLKCDAKTGLISGRPTAAKKDKFGTVTPYDVTLTAKNAKGSATRKFTLRVEPLPWYAVGAFAAPLGRVAALNEGLGGRLEMTILSTGLLSGKAILGTASWPFKGVLDGGPEPTATVTIKRKTGQIPLTMTFGIGGATHYLLRDGSITDGTATLSFTGWRQALAEHVLDFAGYHTFGILSPPLTNAPRATGYGSFTVSKTGTLTLAGKTSDGETITGATFTGIGGDIMIYQTLYTTKLKGSLQGSMKIDHTGSTNAENTLEGIVSWSRPASTTMLFPDGFGPEEYMIVGGGYAIPDAKAGQIVMALPDAPANAVVYFNPYFGSAYFPDIVVRIKPGGLVERPLLNPAKTTLVITSASGAFTGSFTLVDANPLPVPASPRTINRTVKYQGLIFRQNGGWTGAGYFLMPELPSAQWPTASKTPLIPGDVYFGPP
jgi:hypothetical protein